MTWTKKATKFPALSNNLLNATVPEDLILFLFLPVAKYCISHADMSLIPIFVFFMQNYSINATWNE